MAKPVLTIELLINEAQSFAAAESAHQEPSLFGVTDGKAVGTYLEHKFKEHLHRGYELLSGNSAAGIDLPSLGVDLKVTSFTQPQSSCPYKSATQKIFGLGYALLVFVYRKTDLQSSRSSNLDILHVVYVAKEQTGDFQMTMGLKKIIDNQGNEDDLVAFMMDKNLPVDEIGAHSIAEELLSRRTLHIGYLTISNAQQWRLQYSRAIKEAGSVSGVIRVK